MPFSVPISCAMLSYGMSGEVFHGPLLRNHPGFRLSKILERSQYRASKQYPESEVVRSLEAVLTDDSIELVVVNTPHDSHYPLASRVIESGKHLVVEKPFVVTVEEGNKLLEQARAQSVKIGVFQNRRWDGDFLTVSHLIRSGMLGKLVVFESHYDRYRPVIDIKSWKEVNPIGSGILYNLGSHLIDQALVLFGLPNAVYARIDTQREGGVSPDFCALTLYYDNHLQVHLSASYLVREPGPRYCLHGDAGSFVKYGMDPQEEALKSKKIPGSAGWGTESKKRWGTIHTTVSGMSFQGKIETFPGNYLAFYDEVYQAIRNGKNMPVTGQEGVNVVSIIELAQQSNREERKIYRQGKV